MFFQTLESLSLQENIDAEVLVLDQFYDTQTELYCDTLSNNNISFRYHIIEAKNLCYARNEAIKLCKTNILLYIDSDAIADKRWALLLKQTLEKDNVWVAWWKIIPLYENKPLFISQYGWVQSLYSLLDLWNEEFISNKVVWANFWINLFTIGRWIYFDEKFARRKWMLISWDENDYVKKVKELGFAIMYNWRAIVQHQILNERISYYWIWKRMYYQWYSKYISNTKPIVTWFSKEKKWIFYYMFLGLFSMAWLLWYLQWFFQWLNNKVTNK